MTCKLGSLHSVRLGGLPSGFQLPTDMVDRFWFDSTNERLVFRGFMSKAVFDRLDRLHRDPHYQRAIEELFRISVYEEIPIPRQRVARSMVPTSALLGAAIVLASAMAIYMR